MKRKRSLDHTVTVKKKRNNQQAALAKFLLLCGTGENHLTASLTYFLAEAIAGHDHGENIRTQTFLRAYLDNCPDCQHVLAPLELKREKRSQDLLLVCFQCLEQVLLFTASPSLPADSASPDSNKSSAMHYTSVGLKLVATILSSHMRCIYSCLQTTQPMRLVASCLKLLTAMVLQGPSTARDIQQSFNFGYKPLQLLPSRTHQLQGMTESVRHCLIKFALSFLVVAGSDVISSILELKGFLSSFFKLLTKDSVETCQLLLNTLLQKGILNTEISKRIKSSFFNHYVLKQTSQLLLTASTESSSDDEESSCGQVAFQFLLRLCTDFQCGICYKSKPPPEGLERSNNPVILHFLLSLTGSLGCPLVQELTAKALAACPDMLLPYFKSLALNFDPQPTVQWMETTEFMIRILSSIPSVVELLGFPSHKAVDSSRETPPPLTYLKAAVGLTIPSSLTRSNLSLGIQHPVPLVRYQTLRLMQAVLERATAVVKFWGPVKTSLTTIDSFLVCYRDAVMKSLPDVHTLISLRQQLIGLDGKEATKVGTLSLEDQMRNLELYESSSLLCLTLAVLRGYQRLSPLLFMQVDFNVAKLLPSIGIDEEMTSSNIDTLTEALQILLESPSGSLKGKQLSTTFLPNLLRLYVICEDEAVANLAHQVAVKFLRQSHVLVDYKCELEIILLTLRTRCCSIHREAASSLIQFVADLFLSSLREHHNLEARVETILSSRSRCGASTSFESSLLSESCAISLEEILSAPLVVSDVSMFEISVDEVHTQSKICSLVPCLLSKLEVLKPSEQNITSFIVDVLPKLLLVYRSSSCESFATVVMDYLRFDQEAEATSEECLYLARLFGDWISDDGFETSTTIETSKWRKSTKRKSDLSQIWKPAECDRLTFLSALGDALHSESGTHPLDLLVMVLSDQYSCDALERSFEMATAIDSPALACSLRAVQVLLSRLHAHWKNTGLREDQVKVVSFLFSLLLKAVRRLSHFETTNRAGLLTADKDQVCGLLEQVMDKWFVETLFLNDEWLSDIGQDERSVQQRKKRRRKSRESSQVETSVDFLCSSQMGELLHVAMESCSQFRTSPVVKLALTRLFNGSKMLLVGAQRDGALGDLLTELIKLLKVAADVEELLSFTEHLLLTDSSNCSAKLLASVLSIVLIPRTNIELIQSFQEESVSDGNRQWSISSLCTDLSNLALSKLISLTCNSSCEELNAIAYCALRCKLQQSRVVEGDLLRCESAESYEPAGLDKDGLISSMHVVTRALLSTDTALPMDLSKPKNGRDLAVSFSPLTRSLPLIEDSSEQCTLREIFESLERTCQSNPHSKKLLDCSLFSKLVCSHLEHSPSGDSSRDGSFCISAEEGKALLDHAVITLSPACAKLAGLLLNRSQSLMLHFVSHSISKFSEIQVDDLDRYHSSGDTEEVMRICSYLHVMAEFFKALNSDECLTRFDGDLKRTVKMIRKSLGSRYLHIPHIIDDQNAVAVQVIRGICRHSTKGLKCVCEDIKSLDMETSTEDGPWNQYQISIACLVAMETLDHHLCGVAIKRAVQKLSEFLGDEASKQEDRLMKDVLKLLQLMYSKGISLEVQLLNEEWSGFLQATLRSRFHFACSFKLVTLLLSMLPENGDSGQVVVDLKKLYKLIWSHSEFVPVMSSERDEETKECLIELLVTIVERQPKVCQTSHISTLLSAYSATMTTTDRGLLYLLYRYEEHGVSTAAYRPYLWGSAATEQYQQRQEVGWLLWKQPGMQEVVELLNRKHLFQSATDFPVSVQLEPLNPFSAGLESTELTNLYDPCFLLPHLSHLLDPGNLVDCHQFVEHGCLSYLIMALSSRQEEVRDAAGHTLTRFSHHLEGGRFREKAQIVLLLEVLKNTITEPCMRVSSIVAAFCARAARLFLDPDNPLYPVVGHFIVYKPALDLNDIPLYSVLLHSSSTQHKAERRWLLNVLINGLKCDEDLIVFRRKRVLSQVLSLFTSDILDQTSQALVIKLIWKAACVSNSARDLLFCGGLCSLL